jgi:transposase InsO family protein
VAAQGHFVASFTAQTDFTYFKIIGWGWVYPWTILDDLSRYIISWKLGTTMKTTDGELARHRFEGGDRDAEHGA